MYSLVVPEDLVKELYLIRTRAKVSIRSQILTAIEDHIQNVNCVNSAGVVRTTVRETNKK